MLWRVEQHIQIYWQHSNVIRQQLLPQQEEVAVAGRQEKLENPGNQENEFSNDSEYPKV